MRSRGLVFLTLCLLGTARRSSCIDGSHHDALLPGGPSKVRLRRPAPRAESLHAAGARGPQLRAAPLAQRTPRSRQRSPPSFLGLLGRWHAAPPRAAGAPRSRAVALGMAGGFVTPIGPFCPFRSAAFDQNGLLGVAMNNFSSSKMPRLAVEMSRLKLEMSMDGTPDPQKIATIADEIVEMQGEWQSILQRMRLADDFQTREYFMLTAVWMERRGQPIEMMGAMVRWQAENMKAFATGGTPVPPPPGIDIGKLAAQEESGQANMMSQIGRAQSVTAGPFESNGAGFESDIVKKEWVKLCSDHTSLIKMGESYGSFDPLGKLAFIDALEAVEERWDTFFARFSLMGALNQEYVEQTSSFLSGLGMTVTDFREVLKEAHGRMRKAAEVERGIA